MADKDVSASSCCPHHDVDDGQGPQDVIPKSESFDDDDQKEDGDD